MANEARIEARWIDGNFRIRLYGSGIPAPPPAPPEVPLREEIVRAEQITPDSIRNALLQNQPPLATFSPSELTPLMGLLLSPIAAAWEALRNPELNQPLRTYFDLDAKLRGVPMEALARSSAEDDLLDFYALDIRHSFLRFHPAVIPSFTGKQVRMIIISGTDELEPGVSSEAEVAAIQRSLQGCECSVHLEILRLPVSEQVLTGELEALQPHLVHFIGHGGTSPYTNRNSLMFNGWAWDVSQISAFFGGTAWRPRLVFLNACFSAGSREPTTDVARALTRHGVAAVLGMQSAIRISCALAFTKAFYGALAEGKALDTALQLGRMTIAQSITCGGVDQRQWVLPTLSVAIAPNEVLPLPRYRTEILRCHVRQELMVKNTFVDRFRERRKMLKSIAPYSPGEPFSRGILLRGKNDIGKTWLVKRCLIELAQFGYVVRYVDLAGDEPVSYLDALDRLRKGDRTIRSPLHEPFPAQFFEKFDRLFDSIRARVGEQGFTTLKQSEIDELFAHFRSGLEAMATPSRGVVLAMDRFSKDSRSSLRPEDFNDVLLPGLIEPILDAAESNIAYIFVMREAEVGSYGISTRMPQLQDIDLHMFPDGETRYLFDEYTRFAEGELMDSLYRTFRVFIESNPEWSPALLEKVLKPWLPSTAGR